MSKDISTHLKEASEQVLEAKKHRNQSWLSRESGVAAKTLSRFLKGEVQKMSPLNMNQLAKFLISDINANCISEEGLSAIKGFLHENEINPLHDRGNESLGEKIERYMVENQDEAVLVYCLCCNHNGVAHKVVHGLGERCRHYLEEFLRLGWVREEKNRYHALESDFSLTRNFLIQRMAKIYIDRCHPELWNRNRDGENGPDNLLYVYQESLSPEAMHRITEVLAGASNTIVKILGEESAHGELPCSIVLFNDILSR